MHIGETKIRLRNVNERICNGENNLLMGNSRIWRREGRSATSKTKSRLAGATGRDGGSISGFSSSSRHHHPRKEKSIALLMRNTLPFALQS
jgi:hypothetical protein